MQSDIEGMNGLSGGVVLRGGSLYEMQAHPVRRFKGKPRISPERTATPLAFYSPRGVDCSQGDADLSSFTWDHIPC